MVLQDRVAVITGRMVGAGGKIDNPVFFGMVASGSPWRPNHVDGDCGACSRGALRSIMRCQRLTHSNPK